MQLRHCVLVMDTSGDAITCIAMPHDTIFLALSPWTTKYQLALETSGSHTALLQRYMDEGEKFIWNGREVGGFEVVSEPIIE